MSDGHRYWIDLLNAQDGWITDESMLGVIPEEAREFASAPQWPRNKALAYLNNNTNALRLNYVRLETGESLDTDLLNPVLGGISLRLVDWRRRPEWQDLSRERWGRGERLFFLQPHAALEGWNKGSAHIRIVVQRAFYHFARYADQRLGDPSWPGSIPGMFRVLKCAAPRCPSLVPCLAGRPQFCSGPCSEDTGRIR